jgi:hypothetical protein
MKSSSIAIFTVVFTFFLATPCFSSELYQKLCQQGYDVCLKNCTRQHEVCKVGSNSDEGNQYCDGQYTAEGNPCVKKCDNFKEECAQKTNQ